MKQADTLEEVTIVDAWRDAAAHAFFTNVWPMYVHDISGFDTDFYELDASGVWQPDIARYWAASTTQAVDLLTPRADDDPGQPFQRTHVIMRGSRPVGFACVARPPFKYMTQGVDQTFSELFLIHAARGDGTAARAVELVLRAYAGSWSMLVIHDNARALRFWRKTLPLVGARAIDERTEGRDVVVSFATGELA